MLSPKELQNFVSGLNTEEGQALAKKFETLKLEFALEQVQKPDMTEYARGVTAGVIKTMDLFIGEFRKAKRTVRQDEEKETIRYMSQDSFNPLLASDLERVLNKAKSLKS